MNKQKFIVILTTIVIVGLVWLFFVFDILFPVKHKPIRVDGECVVYTLRSVKGWDYDLLRCPDGKDFADGKRLDLPQ